MKHRYDSFYTRLIEAGMSHWLETLPAQLTAWHQGQRHGEAEQWHKLLNQLQHIAPLAASQANSQVLDVDLEQQVRIGHDGDLAEGQKQHLTRILQGLMPWRKGPYSLFGIEIDTEWRSDWKWDRVLPHISDLNQRKVLDIGCGSGYHLWRMKGAGADLVVGIDPTELFVAQFQAIKHFIPEPLTRDVHMLPLGIEAMPALQSFDTVFTMGVLYHRRSPLDFIQQCKDLLKSDGELIMETLVIEGDEQQVLCPQDRYAQMKNVWFIPSTQALCLWLERLGMVNIRVVDENVTSLDEQRATPWMQSQSLVDFLDPNDHSKTIEGYPAPKRVVVVCQKK